MPDKQKPGPKAEYKLVRTSLSLREPTARALKEKAKADGASLNKTADDLLSKALKVG